MHRAIPCDGFHLPQFDLTPLAEIAAWYPQSGKDLKAFFNTSGLIYREQQLKDKLPGLSEEEKLALLASNGMLVKRPILVLEDKVLVGFKEKEWMEALNL